MNESKPKILVVDDDLRLRQLLERYLSEQGFTVKAVPDAPGMDRALERELYDLIVLDLMLPGIVGLEVGADDYLPKPFSPRELVARIHAVLRRQTAPPPPGAPAITEETVSFGKVKINLATRELECEEVVTLLTSGEFGLLRVLLEHPRQPMSRDKLMELARGREYEVFDRAIDVQISRLRKLVEEDPGKPRYIQTVWGFGYVFVPEGTKHSG
jgi:two-component system phosphate regulon response regulator OmpR